VHYIYDRSPFGIDTRTAIESSKPMSSWNDAVMQCTMYMYMIAYYPGVIQYLLSFHEDIGLELSIAVLVSIPNGERSYI
jgi:hypothetical protein